MKYKNFNKINPQFINGKTEKALSSIERVYLYNINFFISYRMNASKDNKGNVIIYIIILNTHIGKKNWDNNVLLKKQQNCKNYERLFSLINRINLLREYKKEYEEHNWIYKKEYKEVF